jgi:hypothetical protein
VEGIKLRLTPRNRIQAGIQEHLMEFIWRRHNQGDLWQGFLNALKEIAFD